MISPAKLIALLKERITKSESRKAYGTIKQTEPLLRQFAGDLPAGYQLSLQREMSIKQLRAYPGIIHHTHIPD